ncbi:MAG: hypothetical protein M1821_008805 [Bathelium mastoideum]|nr:MAG: hypothetical protein M1821_008805 [Bathelium mastoideum]
MAPQNANPLPKAMTSSPARRSTASPERRSRYHDITDQLHGADQHYPPGFDLNGFEDIILPPASALTSQTSPPSMRQPFESDDEDEDVATLSSANTFLERCKTTALSIPTTSAALTQNHRTSIQARAKSIASLVPAWNSRQAGSSQEPILESAEPKPRRTTTFGDLFAGTSAPINIGIIPSPSKEKPSMDFTNDSNSDSRPSHKRAATALSSSSTSKFSWFGSKPFNPAPTPTPSSHDLPLSHPSSSLAPSASYPTPPPPDPLLDLSFDAALFPHGPLDRLDPSSFNALLHAATSALTALHTGYRARYHETQTARAEVEAHAEEAAEAETRARHLKQQLDELAQRGAEQAAAMQDLAEELARERLLRREVEARQKRSVRLVREKHAAVHNEETAEGERDESYSGEDAGADTDAASSAGSSVFSRTREAGEVGSPASSITTPLSMLGTEWAPDNGDTSSQRTRWSASSAGQVGSGKPRPAMSLEDHVDRRLGGSRLEDRCQNCQGGSQTNAWALVTELRRENKGLKGRVVELERSVEGCLDLVTGLGG